MPTYQEHDYHYGEIVPRLRLTEPIHAFFARTQQDGRAFLAATSPGVPSVWIAKAGFDTVLRTVMFALCIASRENIIFYQAGVLVGDLPAVKRRLSPIPLLPGLGIVPTDLTPRLVRKPS